MTSVRAAGAQEARAQETLRAQIDRHRDGLVSLSYAARPDACGTTTMLRIGGEDWTYTTSSAGGPWPACERGVARVLIRRAEGQTVWLSVAVGAPPAPAREGMIDLGTVPARAAAAYFLELAGAADGRVGRDALLPAVLADSAETWRGLVSLARDRALSRGLRESALTWLGRELAAGRADAATVTDLLARMMADPEEPSGVRTRAVSALGRSGHAQAREALRREARNASLSRAERAQVIRALGGREATPSDYRLLRELWPTLDDSRTREALLNTLAEAGGSENVRWLLGVAGDIGGLAHTRSHAVNAAVRAGASTADLSRLYDGGADRRVKEAILEGLIRIGDRAAIAKVSSIAETDTDPAIRRSAVNRLARSGGEDAADVLRRMVERP